MNFILEGLALVGFIGIVVLAAALWTYFGMRKQKDEEGHSEAETKDDGHAV